MMRSHDKANAIHSPRYRQRQQAQGAKISGARRERGITEVAARRARAAAGNAGGRSHRASSGSIPSRVLKLAMSRAATLRSNTAGGRRHWSAAGVGGGPDQPSSGRHLQERPGAESGPDRLTRPEWFEPITDALDRPVAELRPTTENLEPYVPADPTENPVLPWLKLALPIWRS
jgi:hypothetical protein